MTNPSNQRGRPRVLADQQKRNAACAMISLGAGIEEAARHVGCCPVTIRREAQRDEAFAQQLREAETAAKLKPLRALRQAADTHWRAAAWLLERTCPERFARRTPTTVTADDIRLLVDRVAAVLIDECYDAAQGERVLHRLQQLYEDRFSAPRAEQHGPPEAMSGGDKSSGQTETNPVRR